ncbi:MAG: YidC/Oxa1 family membrane protein insertase [Oscillospiraceae bacterium]|jgi:YidC/Oxa1 family membrane protein insertase|nr:YidC/Oxa1 family membrane protein insertase [Oscillospiraceae bacterium]
MFGFVDFFAGILGFFLGFLFEILGNYGVAVLFFTLIISVVMFPFAIRRQRGMTPSARFEMRREELRKRCGTDAQRFNQEFMVLSQEENFNPLKGLLNISMISTIVILSGIYGAIQRPLTNVLHLPIEKVNLASEVLPLETLSKNKNNAQLELVRNFDTIKEKLTMFSVEETIKISKLSSGFSFLGLSLLDTPKYSKFSSMLWIIPLLSLFSSVVGTYIMQKISGSNEEAPRGKFMMYLFPIFQAWIVYTVFAAVGIYLVFSSILGVLQTVMIDRFFSVYAVNARKEYFRFKKMLEQEKLNY